MCGNDIYGNISGKIFETKQSLDAGDEGGTARKAKGEMQMPIEIDLPDEDDEDEQDEDTSEGAINNALDHAPERDLVDLAGILGQWSRHIYVVTSYKSRPAI